MIFNSFKFLLFFPITTLLYYLIPHKFKWIYLLLVSYGFYMNWNPSYALLLLGITVISYTVGLSTERNRRKQTLSVGIVLCLLPLIVFKYMNFINESVFSILHTCGLRIQIPEFKLLLPVGISFFTFKAISYMIDIYKGKLVAEKHPGIYALYISLFVDLAAGPIDRANTLTQR